MMDSVYFAQEIVKATDVGKLRAAKTASQTYLLISAISAINILISSKDSSSYSGEKEMCWSIIKVHRYKIIINNNAPTRIRLYALASMLGLRTLIMALRMMNLIKSRSKAL